MSCYPMSCYSKRYTGRIQNVVKAPETSMREEFEQLDEEEKTKYNEILEKMGEDGMKRWEEKGSRDVGIVLIAYSANEANHFIAYSKALKRSLETVPKFHGIFKVEKFSGRYAAVHMTGKISDHLHVGDCDLPIYTLKNPLELTARTYHKYEDPAHYDYVDCLLTAQNKFQVGCLPRSELCLTSGALVVCQKKKGLQLIISDSESIEPLLKQGQAEGKVIMRFWNFECLESTNDFLICLEDFLMTIVKNPFPDQMSNSEALQAALYLENQELLPRAEMNPVFQLLLSENNSSTLETESFYWLRLYFKMTKPNIVWASSNSLKTVSKVLPNVTTVHFHVTDQIDLDDLVGKFPQAHFSLLGNVRCRKEVQDVVSTVSGHYAIYRIVMERTDNYLAVAHHDMNYMEPEFEVCQVSKSQGYFCVGDLISVKRLNSKAEAEGVQVLKRDIRPGKFVMRVTRNLGVSLEDPGKAIFIPNWVPEGQAFNADVFFPKVDCHSPSVIRFRENEGKRYQLYGHPAQEEEVIEQIPILGAAAMKVLQFETDTNKSPPCLPLQTGYMRGDSIMKKFLLEFFKMRPRKSPEEGVVKGTCEQYDDLLNEGPSRVLVVSTPKSNISKVLARPRYRGSHLIIVNSLEDVRQVKRELRMPEDKFIQILRQYVMQKRYHKKLLGKDAAQLALYLKKKGKIQENEIAAGYRSFVKEAENSGAVPSSNMDEVLRKLNVHGYSTTVTTFEALPSIYKSLGSIVTVQMTNTSWPVMVPILVKFGSAKIGIVGDPTEKQMSVAPCGELNLLKLHYPMMNIPI